MGDSADLIIAGGAFIAMMLTLCARSLWLARGAARSHAALCGGDPGRARAYARIHARGAGRAQRRLLALNEANALLWSGRFDRALVLASRNEEASAHGRREKALRVAWTILKLHAFVFQGRFDDAGSLLDLEKHNLEAELRARGDLAAVRGFIAFHEGDRERASSELAIALEALSHGDPTRACVWFCLAALAHEEGRHDDTRRMLLSTTAEGRGLFVEALARVRFRDLFPSEASPASAPLSRAPRSFVLRPLRDLAVNLVGGVERLTLQPRPLTGRFTLAHIAALAAFDAALLVGARCLVDYRPGAVFLGSGTLTLLVAPLLLFLVVVPIVVARGRRSDALRFAGGFYAALPVPLALSFGVARIASRLHLPSEAGLFFDAALGLWLLAAFMKVARGGIATRWWRLLVGALAFIVICLGPLYDAQQSRVFYSFTSPEERTRALHGAFGEDDEEGAQEDHDARVLAQADHLNRLESALAAERPGVVDLYFVGAAGWARQDVFGREMQSARQMMDARFDTAGRSLIMSNDPATRDSLPLASTLTLRHALRRVGQRMNVEEDVLFLFVTSHGSQRGIALGFAKRAAFDDQTLTPDDLRSMLDEAHIRWRVLVLSGCESGVFVSPLQNDHTLIATAAADDRYSYGCANGNAFTDFGRAVFSDELPRERSFATAFTKATQLIEKRETADERVRSMPRVHEGALIREKLRAIEDRVP